jgi:antitoxin CcdA
MVQDDRLVKRNALRLGRDPASVDVEGARRAEWIEANREAIEAWNAYVAEHGLPLESFRAFDAG